MKNHPIYKSSSSLNKKLSANRFHAPEPKQFYKASRVNAKLGVGWNEEKGQERFEQRKPQDARMLLLLKKFFLFFLFHFPFRF
ncbi:MAG TPA: hypothetical protein VJI71_02830 [Candidatus Norongarragalinales archaeon]|nr:hypothetical protein [Candidatus Norongarragalinales archaeon]